MIARLSDKNKAIELRKEGRTYAEIQQIIPVSRGLLSFWFENLAFSRDEKERIALQIVKRHRDGVLKSIAHNRRLKLNREIVAYEAAKKIFQERRSDYQFLMGISLYWAHGATSQGAFQFVNSDADMALFMYKWIQKYLALDNSKIKIRFYCHKVPGYENLHLFWMGKLGVTSTQISRTVYKAKKRQVKKNPDYKGSIGLSVTSIYILRLMKAWQKLLIQYYGDMRS